MEVLLTNYTEALDLYYSLMAKSPNLSEKVMIETINKEAEIPGALLTMILQSNPTAAKSMTIKQKLDDRMIPLTEYQRYMIDQGVNLVSQKENLESQITYHNSQYHALLTRGLNLILQPEIIDDVIQEVDISAAINYLGDNIRVIDYYMITELYAQRDEIENATSWLNNISNDFELTSFEIEESSDYLSCFEIRQNALENESLNSMEITILEEIMDKDKGRASAEARLLLSKYDNLFHEPYIAIHQSDKVFDHYTKFTPPVPEKGIKMYPNPASEYLMMESYCKEISFVNVIDANGTIIKSVTLSNGSFNTLNVQDLKNGTYQVLIKFTDGEQEIQSIEIMK